jgi:hypothetical protein
MSCVSKLDLCIIQGATFSKALNWYGGGKVCKLIEALVPGCPTQITVTAHGLPSVSDTPVFIKHVKGATNANTEDDKPVVATYIDPDNFYVDADTFGQTYKASTGLITYYAPKDLTGYTARMQIREDIDDATEIIELLSPTDIDINLADARITITIADDVTALFTFEEAVYDLELEDSNGVTTRLIEGRVALTKEVTR